MECLRAGLSYLYSSSVVTQLTQVVEDKKHGPCVPAGERYTPLNDVAASAPPPAADAKQQPKMYCRAALQTMFVMLALVSGTFCGAAGVFYARRLRSFGGLSLQRLPLPPQSPPPTKPPAAPPVMPPLVFELVLPGNVDDFDELAFRCAFD